MIVCHESLYVLWAFAMAYFDYHSGGTRYTDLSRGGYYGATQIFAYCWWGVGALALFVVLLSKASKTRWYVVHLLLCFVGVDFDHCRVPVNVLGTENGTAVSSDGIWSCSGTTRKCTKDGPTRFWKL